MQILTHEEIRKNSLFPVKCAILYLESQKDILDESCLSDDDAIHLVMIEDKIEKMKDLERLIENAFYDIFSISNRNILVGP